MVDTRRSVSGPSHDVVVHISGSSPRLSRRWGRDSRICEDGIEGLPAARTQAAIHEPILRAIGFIFEREPVAWVLVLDEDVATEWTRLIGRLLIPF